MAKIIYTPITNKTIKTNGIQIIGAVSYTKCWNENQPNHIMEVEKFGKTIKESEQKLINFLSSNGNNKIECITVK